LALGAHRSLERGQHLVERARQAPELVLGVDGQRPYCTADGLGAVLSVVCAHGLTGAIEKVVDDIIAANPELRGFQAGVDIKELAADPTQDVSGLKVGPEEMLVVFALLVHGSTVAEAVGIAITANNTASGENLEGETDEERDERRCNEGGQDASAATSTPSREQSRQRWARCR